MSKKSRKQRHRKRAKNSVQKESSEVLLKKQNKSSTRQDALNYLSNWNTSHSKQIKKEKDDEPTEQWRFQKSKQVWLLKNMFNLEKVPAKYFKIMISYIESIEGNTKERVLEEALEMIENKDQISFDELEDRLIEEADTPDESKQLKEKVLSAKIKRIEKIADKLS